MSRIVILPDYISNKIENDLNILRDQLPENERQTFEAERQIHRQSILDYFYENGLYPDIKGVEKS
jgi:hypothetical protein